MYIYASMCIKKWKERKGLAGYAYTELLTVIISEECWGVGMKEEKNMRDKEKSIYF